MLPNERPVFAEMGSYISIHEELEVVCRLTWLMTETRHMDCELADLGVAMAWYLILAGDSQMLQAVHHRQRLDK